MNLINFTTHDKYNNSIFINESKREFRLKYGIATNWAIIVSNWYPSYSDWYHVSKIIDLSLVETEISKAKGNFGKILATGLLFGPVGAIAGSLGGSQKITNKTVYSVRFTLNDLNLAVVDLQCMNLETALRVINTIKLLKESKDEKKIKRKKK